MKLSAAARGVLLIVVVLTALYFGGRWWLLASTVWTHDDLCERLMDAVPAMEETMQQDGPAGGRLTVEAVPETRGPGYAQNSYWLSWPAVDAPANGSPRSGHDAHVMVLYESRRYGLDDRHDISFIQIRPLPRNHELVDLVLDLYRQDEGVHLSGLP